MAADTCRTFDRNDAEYFQWLQQHPDGFVVNTGRNLSPDYMLLHKATCPHISRPSHETAPGGFTERDFVKICADRMEDLRAWTAANGRSDGSFSNECSICKPTA